MSYRKLVSAFAVAALTLTLGTPAYSLISFKTNIVNSVWLCAQADPTQGNLTVDTSTGAMHQTVSNVTCVFFNDDFVEVGQGTFDFDLSLPSSQVSLISSGSCTKKYTGFCNANLWSGSATQTGGDSFAECGNAPCVFNTSDPTATARNQNQVDTACSTAFPATTDLFGTSWADKQTTFYQTTNSGATCGIDLAARYCFSLPGVDCVAGKGKSRVIHVSSAVSTEFVVTPIAVKDPFNPDNGTFQVDFLTSGIQITGFNPCDPDTAPKIGGVVPIRSGGCTLTDADHNGTTDNPRFFYDSQAVYSWILAHGGVAADGSATVTVTGTLTDGRHLIGIGTTHTSGTN